MYGWSLVIKNNKITEIYLHDLLVLAAETERRLPAARIKVTTTYWPDTLPEWLSYAAETTSMKLAAATAQQIDNYDFILDIITFVASPEDRALLWAVAKSAAFRSRGPAWMQIAKLRHCDRRTVKNDYQALLLETALRWNAYQDEIEAAVFRAVY